MVFLFCSSFVFAATEDYKVVASSMTEQEMQIQGYNSQVVDQFGSEEQLITCEKSLVDSYRNQVFAYCIILIRLFLSFSL